MKTFFKYFLIILVLPLALYEIYYQYTEFKKHRAASETKTSSTNIRYESRGFYWNYPYNEKFIAYNEDGEEIIIQADALGYRNPEVNTEYDVLLLGDSFTSAANTKEELTFANHIKKAGLTVYNAGIDGTGTIHQAYILNDVLEKIKPKLVVLNFYLGNDFKDNFYAPDVQTIKTSVEKTSIDTNKKTVVELTPAPLPSVPTMVALKAKLRNWVDHSGVFKLFYNTFYLPTIYAATDISYYDRGEMMIMAYNKEQPHPDTARAIQQTENALGYIKKMLEARNVPLLVVGIPSKAQVLKSVREISNFDGDKKGSEFFFTIKKDVDFDKPDRLLAEMCADQQIPYVSLLQLFRQQFTKKLYYHFDAHWNYTGQEIAANEVIPHAKASLKTLPKPPLLVESERTEQ